MPDTREEALTWGGQQNGGLGITLPWGGADYHFRLRLGEWRKIEARCNAGPEEIAGRLLPTAHAIDNKLALASAGTVGLIGKWRTDDVREVILQGLLGGDNDLNLVDATLLVQDYVDDRPLRENVSVAFAIVMASLDGLPTLTGDKKPGEPQGEGSPNPSPTEESRGATSTGAAAGRASRRAKSTK